LQQPNHQLRTTFDYLLFSLTLSIFLYFYIFMQFFLSFFQPVFLFLLQIRCCTHVIVIVSLLFCVSSIFRRVHSIRLCCSVFFFSFFLLNSFYFLLFLLFLSCFLLNFVFCLSYFFLLSFYLLNVNFYNRLNSNYEHCCCILLCNIVNKPEIRSI
jgi:hypothetical protein